jgi:glucokinase
MRRRSKLLGVSVGIDVGGTYTKVGAVTAEGKIVAEAQLPAEVAKGPAAFVGRVCDLLAAWKHEHRIEISSVGMGLAGDVDSEGGTLRFTPNLRGWDGFEFRKAFYARLKRRLSVENDANAAVWGGYVVELKRQPRNVVGVTLGTGVGGGLVVEKRLYRGSTGSAGELGHTIVDPGGAACHCGSHGCLEAYAGSYGILRTAKALLDERPNEGRALRAICPVPAHMTPRHITEAADAGDALAREVWARVGRSLAVGLSNLVLVLNPDVILVLGGVSRAGHWITAPIEEHFARQPFKTMFSHVRVQLAHNTKAGWLGAAFLSLEKPQS